MLNTIKITRRRYDMQIFVEKISERGRFSGGHAFLDGNVKSHRAGCCRRRDIKEIPQTHAGLLSRLVTQQCRIAGQGKGGRIPREGCQAAGGNTVKRKRDKREKERDDDRDVSGIPRLPRGETWVLNPS